MITRVGINKVEALLEEIQKAEGLQDSNERSKAIFARMMEGGGTTPWGIHVDAERARLEYDYHGAKSARLNNDAKILRVELVSYLKELGVFE